MEKFTVLNNAEADMAVKWALNRVVEAILSRIGNKVKAIILTGGFGRGEGGVIRHNGRYRPVNDFDIGIMVSLFDYVMGRKKLQSEVQRLADELSPQVGVKQIDIGITTPLAFRFASNLVAWYEVRNGHRVLWGDIDLKKIMPRFSAHHLSLLDGAIYFLSRGSGLLIPAMYFLPDGGILQRHRENFQIEVDKACMAMGDALLLLHKNYHYSYVKRMKRLELMDVTDVPQGEILRKWYLEAVDRKLRPHFEWPGDEEMVNRWFEVRDSFSLFFLWFEGIRLNRSFEDWEEYSAFVGRKVKDPFRDRLRVLVQSATRSGILKILEPEGRQTLFRHSRRFGWSTMPMLLFSLNRDGVDFDLLRQGRALLGLSDSDGTVRSWQEAVQHYLKVFHPEGVVRELLEGAST